MSKDLKVCAGRGRTRQDSTTNMSRKYRQSSLRSSTRKDKYYGLLAGSLVIPSSAPHWDIWCTLRVWWPVWLSKTVRRISCNDMWSTLLSSNGLVGMASDSNGRARNDEPLSRVWSLWGILSCPPWCLCLDHMLNMRRLDKRMWIVE